MNDLAGPHIEYIRAPDGVSLASWTLGDGPPLVYLAGGPWSHIELSRMPACQRWYEGLAHDRMLVRYDMRGTGLSERDVTDFSLGALARDLEAVVDHLGLPHVALFAAADAGPVAVAYAARHPDRVSALVLWCSWVRMSDTDMSRLGAWRGLIEQDWQFSTEACAHLAMGWSGGEAGRQAARRLREVVTPKVMQDALMALERHDVTDLVLHVRAPALVLHRRDITWLPVQAGSHLASRLPNARLVVLPGETLPPWLGDSTTAARAITGFLDEDRDAMPHDRPRRIDLTTREIDVLRLIAMGKTNSEIASVLSISVRTVERHIGNLYAKIDARGRADATAYALRHGIA